MLFLPLILPKSGSWARATWALPIPDGQCIPWSLESPVTAELTQRAVSGYEFLLPHSEPRTDR